MAYISAEVKAMALSKDTGAFILLGSNNLV